MAFTGAATIFLFFSHPLVQGFPNQLLMVLDAAALSLFAVAGTEKELLYKMHPLIAALLCTITAVGGGTVRDVLLAQVPSVLRSDVYATAALAGSVVMIASTRRGLSGTWAALLGGTVCFLPRVVSVWMHWNSPRVSY
jgi:uncharacterized membrane protein YeiH